VHKRELFEAFEKVFFSLLRFGRLQNEGEGRGRSMLEEKRSLSFIGKEEAFLFGGEIELFMRLDRPLSSCTSSSSRSSFFDL